jgi:hypothetical protein
MKKNPRNAVYYSASRIQTFIQVITTLIMLLLLVLPIYILFHLSQTLKASDVIGPSIAVLLAFTLAFFAVFYLLTSMTIKKLLWQTFVDKLVAARVQEVITSTAAYDRFLFGVCIRTMLTDFRYVAVLVVLIGNANANQGIS